MRALWILLAFPTALEATPALGDDAEASKEEPVAAADAAPAEAVAAEEDAPVPASPSARTSSFGAGFDFFFDSGEQTIRRINSGGGDLVEGRSDISNDGVILGSGVGFALWYMTDIYSHLALGGSVRLLGNYGYELDQDPDNPVELGQTLEIAPRLQYLLPITHDFGLTFAGEFGLALLFPGSDLAARIDMLDAQGFDATGLPRLGFVVGPQVGGRYTVNEWLALRLDLGILWEKLFLLNASAESGGLRGEEKWDVSWTRIRLHLGAELMF